MIRLLQRSSRLVRLVLLLVILVAAGCKSKKKAMEAQAAQEKARMEQEAALRKQQEEEERKRREAEAAAKASKETEVDDAQSQLGRYFSAISNSSSVTSANSSINEALALFASEEAPVLIVISETDGTKDYDRPTTIKDYLNYLKDQKRRPDKIGDLQFDSSGKITEVELVKQ